MRKFILIISIILVFFTQLSFAADENAKSVVISLREAILMALRFNPNVQSGEIQRVLDKYAIRVAFWNFAPQYSISGSANYSNILNAGQRVKQESVNVAPNASLTTPFGTQLSMQMTNLVAVPGAPQVGNPYFYNPALSFNLTQPLLQGFGPSVTLAPLHRTLYQEIVNRLTLKNTVIQTITTVISQYAAVAQAENSIKVQRLSLENSIATLKQQNGLLKTGRIAPADLVQFQSSVASQRLALAQQEVNLTQTKRLLLTTLGIDPLTEITTTENIQFDEHLPTLKESIDLALKHNIAYQQELINLKIVKIALLQAQDQQRWQLNFTASHVRGGGFGGPPNSGVQSIFNGKNYASSVGLNLTVPIDNCAIKQSLAQAQVGLHQEYIKLAAQRRQVINDVINAYNTVQSQKQQIVQAQTAVKLAQQSLDIAQIKLKYGRITPFEVSSLQIGLISQQLGLINANSAYMTNLAGLDQIIGLTLDRWKICVRY